ncbi:MAG: translation elongation factor Ts [Bacteroidia bacterium]
MSTMTISASDVNKLRQQTGAGMMDCKKALTEANGDFEQAVDYLRKKGQKVAANRGDRDAKEGLVIAQLSADHKRAIIIRLSCETDFVAKNDDFVNFATTIAKIALDKKPASLEALVQLPFDGSVTIADKIIEQVGKIGEKLELANYEAIEAPKVIAYNHPGNRLATIVGFNKEVSETIAKDIAMQAAAMAPVALDKEDVDSKTLEREIEIGKEQARQEGKAEEMLEKIALGKLNKFYKEFTLLNQEFIKDNKKTIRQYLSETDKDLKITGFKRIALS